MKKWLIVMVVLTLVFGQKKALAVDSNLANNLSDWLFETSGSMEKVTKVDGGWKFEAGGYMAGTHYARAKYKLPEKTGDGLKSFWIKTEVELPSDFYLKQKAGFRLINTDNFGVTVNGKKFGASGVDELRVGLYFNSDKFLQVVADYENHERMVVWAGSEALTTGSHTIEFYGNVAEVAPWALVVDGIKMAGGNARLSPDSTPVGERMLTRIVAGIDGAADQDANSMSLVLKNVYISDRPGAVTVTPAVIQGDFNGDGKADMVDFSVWKNKYLAGQSTLVEFGVWKKAYLAY